MYYLGTPAEVTDYYNVIHLLQASRMEEKQARLTILIDPKNKKAFDALCSASDLTTSQMVRQLILDYLSRHGVPYDVRHEKAKKKVAVPKRGR